MPNETLEKPFGEEDAVAIFTEWCKKNNYARYTIGELTRWNYVEPPFYSASGLLTRKTWPEKMRFHIHANGEVTVFKVEEE